MVSVPPVPLICVGVDVGVGVGEGLVFINALKKLVESVEKFFKADGFFVESDCLVVD